MSYESGNRILVYGHMLQAQFMTVILVTESLKDILSVSPQSVEVEMSGVMETA